MATRIQFLVTALIVAVATSSQTGCFWLTAQGPNIGPLAIPIPVPVGIQKAKEDQFWNYERYERAPVLGPLQPGGPCEALDEPSDDEVMRALEKARPVQGNWPFLYEVQRNHVRIAKCKIADYVDPPRHMPLVGPVQLHHAHYKCTVYFQEVKRVGWPVPMSSWISVSRDALIDSETASASNGTGAPAWKSRVPLSRSRTCDGSKATPE